MTRVLAGEAAATTGGRASLWLYQRSPGTRLRLARSGPDLVLAWD